MTGITVETGRSIFSIDERNKQKSTEYIIYLFKKGSGLHILNGIAYKFRSSYIHFISPGETHFFQRLDNPSGLCIRFSEDFIFSNTEHKDILFKLPFFSYELRNPQIKLTKKTFEWACALAENMRTEINNIKPFSEKIVLSCLNILILHANNFTDNINMRSNPKRPGNLYTQTDPDHYTSLQITANYKKLISRFYAQEHSVAYYAAKLNVTSDYLNKVVKSTTGQTASQLIHARIMQESKYLLIHSNLSMKEVGSTLGFADHSYFTKFFRRYSGQTPLAWFNSNK